MKKDGKPVAKVDPKKATPAKPQADPLRQAVERLLERGVIVQARYTEADPVRRVAAAAELPADDLVTLSLSDGDTAKM